MVSSIGAMAMPRRAMTSMSYLMLWPILRTPGSSSSGFSRRSASSSGHLRRRIGDSVRLPWLPGASVRHRHVAGLARRHRQREAAPAVAFMGSSEVVSVSKATVPASVARAIQASSAAGVLHQRVAVAIDGRRRPRTAALGRRARRAVDDGLRLLRGAAWPSSRAITERNWFSFRKAMSTSRSGWRRAKEASGWSTAHVVLEQHQLRG